MEDENFEEGGAIPYEMGQQGEYEDQMDYGDYQGEVREDQQFGSIPGVPQRDSIYSFFRHILGIRDSTKVGNLDKWELGKLDLSVRNCESLAKLGTMLHNKSYNEYFMNKAEITLATSMSKKGWLPELVVSQKRFSQRMVQPTASPQQQQKKGFFNFGKSNPQPQQ